ncbi:MAG: PKD domain-containing protein, partial [Candidatus Bipolaricaulaceae bacterium]
PVVEHVFETPGLYRVYLTVRSEGQSFSQDYVDVDVRSQTPVARLSADPYPEVQAGKPVHFDASASFDPDGAIVSYIWSFGDGFWEETGDPQISHIYGQPGEYWVQLVVEDDHGDRSEPAVARVRVVPKGCASCP